MLDKAFCCSPPTKRFETKKSEKKKKKSWLQRESIWSETLHTSTNSSSSPRIIRHASEQTYSFLGHTSQCPREFPTLLCMSFSFLQSLPACLTRLRETKTAETSSSNLSFHKGYSLIMGHFCLDFNKTESHRPAALIEIQIFNNRAHIEISTVTIRGSNNTSTAFCPEAGKYALPHCRPCRIRDVMETLPLGRLFGTKEALISYWQTHYGLGQVVSDSRLFAAVAFGSATFTYPSAALLTTALVVDDRHRIGPTLDREARLRARITHALKDLPALATRTAREE